MKSLSPTAVAGLQMIVVTLLWAAFFVSGKLAVAEANPLAVAELRFLVAGAVLVGLMAWREGGVFRLSAKDWLWALSLGATGVASYNALTFLGLTMAPASDAAMISPSLNPVLTVFIAAFWFREPLTRHKVLGLLLAIAGLGLIFGGPVLLAGTSPERWAGDLLLLASGVVWSAFTLLGKRTAGRFSALGNSTYSAVMGALLLLPFSWGPMMSVNYAALSPAFWGHIIFLALGCTVAAFLLFQRSIRMVGASNTAIYLPLIPIFGVILSVLLLGERPGALQAAGLVVAIVGVATACRPQRTASTR